MSYTYTRVFILEKYYFERSCIIHDFLNFFIYIVNTSGSESSKSFQESPFLLNELKLTKMALKHEVDQRAKLEKNYCEELFSQLKPLPVKLIYILTYLKQWFSTFFFFFAQRALGYFLKIRWHY